jgi:integrase
LKPSTRATYKSIIGHHIKPRWEHVRLAEVAFEDVSEWIGCLHVDGLSASRTRQIHTVFASMLAGAVRARRLPSNPARDELPRLPALKHRYLTHAEVDALAVAAKENATLVRVLAYAGLRFGEVAALRAGNVDIARGRLTIAESMTEVGGKTTFTTPTSHAVRTIPIPRSVADLLAVEIVGKAADDLVFLSPRGGALRGGTGDAMSSTLR